MLSVAEAHEIVGRSVHALAAQRLPLAELLGLRLAEDVTSSVDSPPFDKSQVDGFAISTGDETPQLRVVETVTAGHVAQLAVTTGTTIRVMTGAPLPLGADAVMKWEDCQQLDDATIANPRKFAKPGSCVLRKGAAFRSGEVLLRAGVPVGPLDVALLAEIGHAEVAVTPRPRVGVLPTGDELVAAGEACGPGQIRNSNGPMLIAAVQQAGATAVDLGIARDTPQDLREKITRGLECDVLLVSGGVSAGVKDLVPGVLAELGVEQHFHKVRMKPGKPLWFGTREQRGHDMRATGVSPTLNRSGTSTAGFTGDTPVAHRVGRTLVFGLPGNPVSTYVAFVLFVAPALRRLAGDGVRPSVPEAYPITAPFRHRGGRPTYHPCRLAFPGKDKTPSLELLDWKGSADLATLARAHYLAVLPEGDYELAAGDKVTAICLS